MQNLTFTLGRLAVVLAGALALGSCSRSEYAFLPRSASYLGTTTAAPKARVATTPAPAVATATPEAAAPAVAAAQDVVATPVAAVSPMSAPVAVAAPAKPEAVAVPQVASVKTEVPVAATTAAPRKLNLIQRLAVNKVMRKLESQARKATLNQRDNTASTARGSISGNLRTGIILILIGLLISLLSGISGIFGLIGGIIAIIGLIFIILWLLDEL